MRVAGVELPAGAVAKLALCLEHAGETDLAHRVGVAVDTLRSELQFSSSERGIVLRALATGPAALSSLRVGLMLDDERRRACVRH